MCLTSFLSSDFYESDKVKIARIQELTQHVDPEWVLKLAIFSREYWLRSINHVLLVEASKQLYGKKWVRQKLTKFIDNIVRRPDELLEIVGYYANTNNSHFKSIVLPNALKEAVRAKLEWFNDYQIAKYRGKGNGINLYDLVNMVHAKSNSIDKLMKGTLESADTWEVEISREGNKKEIWLRLMKENKLGALATVRNLRNMIQSWVGTDTIANYLDTIKWSDVFPFQAIQAMDMIYQIVGLDEKIGNIIQKHVKECFKHIASKYEWKIAIGVDISWSMFWSPVTNLSKMDRAKMAITYGQIIKELTGGNLFLWSDNCYVTDSDDITVIYNQADRVKNGTYPKVFTDEIKWKWYDYAIILTDEQISGRLEHVVSKQTVIWGLHDYQNTIASWNGITYFTWYNDIMWKVWSDMFRLGELEKEIDSVIS